MPADIGGVHRLNRELGSLLFDYVQAMRDLATEAGQTKAVRSLKRNYPIVEGALDKLWDDFQRQME